jgi:hypothetical protein
MSRWGINDKGTWETILSGRVALTEVVVDGNGKDCDLTIALADGRRLVAGANQVTVSAEGRVNVVVDAIDDNNLEIRYSGPGLEVRSARVRYGNLEYQEEFRADLRAWLSGDAGEDGLRYVVDAEITVASA